MTVMEAIKRPFRALKRALYLNLGPAKDWSAWRALFLGNNKAKVNVNHHTTLGIPAYWRAIDIVAGQIASLPFSVYERDADGNVREATTHPLYRLLNYRPSPLYDTFIWRETFMRRLLVGVGTNAQTNVNPQNAGNVLIRVITDGRGAVTELRIINDPWEIFEMDGMVFYSIDSRDQPLSASEVIHLRAWSNEGLLGMNPLDYHRNTFGRAISEIDYAASYYGSGAQLSGVLETDMPLNKDQRTLIEDSWNKQYSGPENAGKTALLSHGVKHKTIQERMSGDDLRARELTVQDVSNITGVPLPLLGNTENRYNLEFLNRMFVQYGLRTWCKRIEAEFNSKLFSARDMGRYFVRFDLRDLLRGDLKAQSDWYREMYNIRVLNPNEIRQEIGRNPYDGGDEYGMPLASNSQMEGPAQNDDNEGLGETDD